MYLITPLLTDNQLNNQGYNDILDGIDCTIASIATTQYLNDTLGFTGYVDYDLYDRLCDYREILIDKLMGCGCLEQEHLTILLSKVQNLIR